MSKIGIQLLIGENPEPFLPYAIRSVAWADYYTVVNTGRPDNTVAQENKEIVFSEIPAEKLRYVELSEHVAADDTAFWESNLFSFAQARNLTHDLAGIDDVVVIVDSDDVHFPEFEHVVREYLGQGTDALTVYFYHLMVYKNLYQFTQPRMIVYKNYESTTWVKGVHEILDHNARWPATASYWYLHYGYVKPQREVFKRWKLYSDIEGDFNHYKGQNPDTILDDRVSVCSELNIPHPPVIAEFIAGYPEYPPIDNRGPQVGVAEKVGLILLVHDDEEYLKECLSSLARTVPHPQFEILAIVQKSTDNSLEILKSYRDSGVLSIDLMATEELLPLSEVLNYGLNNFRSRDDIHYIGWIHPDMVFQQPDWLQQLWTTLKNYPKIGKICAANSRDTIPNEMHSGQEQVFIIRKDIVNKIGLFDTNFQGIGGYEDWDYNRRIMNHDGYKVFITPDAKVFHHGMGTRSKRDTTADQIANAAYYTQKWGTGDPPC